MRIAIISFVVAEVSASGPPGVTSFQRARLDAALQEARSASIAADKELLGHLAGSDFKQALRGYGTSVSAALAEKSAHELQDVLKSNLDTVDYTTNFNLEPWQQQWAMGQTLDNIDDLGWFANLWQLELRGYAPRCDDCERAVLDFYKLKPFATSMRPSWEEAAERGVYVFKDIHRMDIGGDWSFGHTVAIHRSSVMRTRSLMTPGDSGAWFEKGCKEQPMKKDDQFDCSAFSLDMPMGVPGVDSEMHMLLRHAVAWGPKYGGLAGSLAAIFHNMLDPKATMDGINDCPEVMVLGSVLMTDLKMLVASFPVLAGTDRGNALVDFCQRHSLPLLWAFSDGHVNTGGYEALTKFVAGRDRLLDPSTVGFTNGTVPSDALATWDAAISELKSMRDSGALPTGADVSDYWRKASAAGSAVAAMRGGDCADTDLCFGTQTNTGCICRVMDSAAPMLV